MLFAPKRTIEEPNLKTGVCVWRLPSGTYVVDDQGNYLVCGPCMLNDPVAERNMRKIARELGIEEGQPFWLPGFRVVSDQEHEDQMERLLQGKIPDLVDVYRQAKMNGQS